MTMANDMTLRSMMRMTTTSPRVALLAGLVVLALPSAGCREQQSFVVVTAQSADSTPISGVVELIVTVTNGTSSKVLTYTPPPDQTPLTLTGILDPVTSAIGKTFSVSFTLSHTDDVFFDVAARDAARCTVGHGTTCANGQGSSCAKIKRGGVSAVTVELEHTVGPCDSDGGTPDGETTFPGCDPAALKCGAGMTCAVNCAALQGQCVVAGAAAPGGLCARNSDCAPGTQCFKYENGTCNVGACLKYCKVDGDCTAMGAGSLCQGKVPCGSDGGTILTSYRTCTFGCDPRGSAATGCPVGLHCFLVDTMDQVDCTCTEPTRTRNEGEACTRGVDCAPGLICDRSNGRCQKVCKRSDNSTDCAMNQVCTMLSNDQVYGVCL